MYPLNVIIICILVQIVVIGYAIAFNYFYFYIRYTTTVTIQPAKNTVNFKVTEISTNWKKIGVPNI